MISKELLLHWWKDYGKNNCTLAEFKEFEHIIDKYGEDKVLDIIAFSFFKKGDCSNTLLLDTIRKGPEAVKELFNSLPENDKKYRKVKEKVSELLSETYRKGSL